MGLFLGAQVCASAEVDSGDVPVELVNTVQGSCPRGQVSTDRGCVTPPQIKKKVQPRYPKTARRDRVQAKVTLGVTVEKDGTAGPIQVMDSSNPGQGFEQAAIDAVKQWHWKPGQLDDGPVRIMFTLVIEFTFR
jgi:TonB family protein